ncbi:DUF1205 domain-containing protein [Rothia sp. AR01]|uniref:DUF1205 domain-containing protein n=1 Tax=Rothia santali TaxID=2949643 RepID=A0A9X2HF37_9MICC|nr:nucleotide disphospho-sugar-binding domain-containing protein [Rothia santali]MCP3424546.1 DUF1205 domain-containing protein [Rothia santali]
MRVLVIGPPLYGLLFPVLSLAQGFRADGHDVVVATAGDSAGHVREAGLVAFDAAPGLDPDAEYRRREEDRKRRQLGTRPGGFSFFSDEMTDRLVDLTARWRPDLIVYPPLGVVGRLLGAKFGIPTVLQTVGFAHQRQHVDTVTGALAGKFEEHGVDGPVEDLRWLDVAPPSMSILEHPAERTLPMRYVPYNGGSVRQDWWDRPERPRVLVSLGTLKPMVDGLDLIDWVMRRADELDAEFVLQLNHNARQELVEDLPENVTLTDWIPMGGLFEHSDLFIHHGGAGNTFTALAAGIPQIVFGQGADRPTNARIVAESGCGVVPGEAGLTADAIRTVATDPAFRERAAAVRAEMRTMPSPAAVAGRLADAVAGV